MNFALVAVQLSDACSGSHKYVHYGNVGLKRIGTEPVDAGLSENRGGDHHRHSRAPVSLDVKIGGRVFLPGADLEYHFGAKRPIAVGLHKITPSEHFIRNLDAEFFENFGCHESVRNALGILDEQGHVLVHERHGHQKSGNQL